MSLNSEEDMWSMARRVTSAPLWSHALALTLVLFALLPLIGTSGMVISDEGVVLAQTDLLADGDWLRGNAFSDIDPDGAAYGLDRGSRTELGFAPYTKHPLHVIVLAPVFRLFGQAGVIGVSLLGVVAASWAAALLTRRFAAGHERTALWLTGVGTPLAVDGYQALGHTVAAAAFATAVVAVLSWTDHPRLLTAAGAVVAASTAALFRAEGVLAMLALAIALTAMSARTWRVGGMFLGGWIGIVAIAIHRFEPNVSDLLVPGRLAGGRSVDNVDRRGFLADRISGTWRTELQPFLGDFDAQGLLVLGGLVLMALGALAARRGRTEQGTVVAAVGAIVMVLFIAQGGTLVPGLLVAMPLVVLALMTLGRMNWSEQFVLATVVVFVGAVLATQYPVGGNVEWGARYQALAVPLIVALAMAGVDRIPSEGRALTLKVFVFASVVTTGVGLSIVARLHDRTDEKVEIIVAAAGEFDTFVVALDPNLPRESWEHLDDVDFLLLEVDQMEEFRDRLAASDRGRFLLVSPRLDFILDLWSEEFDVGESIAVMPSGHFEVMLLTPR